MPALDNYLTLVGRVDELCGRTASSLASHISCTPGCDSCCRHLSIFAVEAAALRQALSRRPTAEAGVIRSSAEESTPDGHCPLLKGGLCLLYEARPIICRTHGLPLLITREGEQEVDFCPRNFQELESIPGSAVIDLERLNAVLAAINALYLQSSPGPERVTIADAILGPQEEPDSVA
ncbi:YkgJ family cysteine cluster protein [Geomonas sp. Red32]|uniref:YkgJ family cysteine cluster protein n=1 Tax=Geomonas sp. Red32 TaxID=2912856 RepID=UPI00202D0159|nr:YkgJ family cysteine cluster protein [Geomonas sp. Red32]MCM0084427.1 YkgJ family cysteine cluster protein [Geomonas sp. Red32]